MNIDAFHRNLMEFNQGRKIVLLSGYKGCGKDTFGGYLVERHGYVRFAFADYLKNLVAEQYKLDRRMLDDEKIKEAPLLHYPVIAKDNFGEFIHTIVRCHFRTSDGRIPTQETTETLYWTPRAILIAEGMMKRAIKSDYWVEKIKDVDPNSNIVVTDFRFPNEYHTLVGMMDGARIVTLRIDTQSSSTATDSSERSLDNFMFDGRILNRKDGLEKYYKEIEKLIHALDL